MTKSESLILLLAVCFIFIRCSKSADIQLTTLDCLPSNLQNGVVAFYPFNNGSLLDAWGNNDLSNPTSAVPGTDRTGNESCAYSFNSSQYLECDTSTFLDNLPSTQFSISLWHNSFEAFGDSAVIISRGEADDDCPWVTGEWSLEFVNQAMTWGANGKLTYGVHSLPANTWHHMVVTSQENEIQIYTDGVLTSSPSSFICMPPIQNSGNLLIGKELDGLIDDIVIYNRVITPAEVEELHALQPCCQ
ncbi:MAG TPA: LamG domain-containing protein [Flavobacterium sp.]|jgi:hypothetical protein